MAKKMIGKKLKKLRQDRGWTQAEVGSRAGIAGSAVSMYENDSREPNLEIIGKLAEVFGVTVDEIMGGDEGRPVLNREAFDKDGAEFGFMVARSRKDGRGHEMIKLVFRGQQPFLSVNEVEMEFGPTYADLLPEDKMSVCKEMLRKAMDEMVRG